MRINQSKQIAALIAGLILYSCCNFTLSAGTPIISVKGNNVTMANDVGCRLDFFYENGKYGLGTFYFQDVALGEPVKYFMTEDNVWENSANKYQTFWSEPWKPYFQADKYEIINNTDETGTIEFSGRMGKMGGTVTITLSNGSSGYKLDYAINILETISHPVYVSGPFFPEKMQFVQFPFETPLSPPFNEQWEITPTLSMVPLMWGCQKINQKDYYIGVGYQLGKDDYQRGKIKYNAAKPAPFQIYFISPNASGWFSKRSPGNLVKLHMVISTADDQYDCVSGYRTISGYDISTPIRRPLKNALQGVMDMYKNSTAYVPLPPYKNSAYHHQIVPSSGAPPLTGYGAYINIGINVQLGYQLYKYWQANPQETWARERALNMAGFYLEVQKEDGSVPSLWDPKEKKFRSYNIINTEKGDYIYTMDRQAAGAYSLHRLYLARKESENISAEELKSSALKAMDYIAGKAISDGILGRSYNKDGKYDMVSAPNEALIALDYFYAQTGDKKYDRAREILEKFTYDTHVFKNHWYDWSSDWGGWRGEGAPPWDIDALNSLSFATYCAYRHMHTGEQKYIDWARHVISYNWLVTIPLQFPGFKYVTKGLTREQNHYLTYDIPFRTTLFVDCYPYLSMVTRDRFFIDFYKMLIQTQHAYQYPTDNNHRQGLRSFDIGLWWNDSGSEPRDEVGEPMINYIVEFSSMYLESVTSPNAYRYVGGADWGVGLDYDLSFTPNAGNDGLYIAAASSNVTDASWDVKKKTLTVSLQAEAGKKGVLNVRDSAGKNLEKSCQVKIDGKAIDKNSLQYDSKLNMLIINYSHIKNLVTVQISMQ